MKKKDVYYIYALAQKAYKDDALKEKAFKLIIEKITSLQAEAKLL